MNFPYQRITVTGGAGFVGRVVAKKFQAFSGVEVFVPRSRDYNLVEKTNVERLLDDAEPELIIHLAAVVGGIGFNREHPARCFYDNLMMGTHLMEQACRRGVRKFVAVGTVCAYPKFAPVPFREADLWNGYPEETNAPYGLAKKMMLVQAQSYRQEYGFNAIYLLPSNVYGPGDNADLESSHVIPALIRKCVEAKEAGAGQIEAWGTGQASRDFLYVDDCATGIISAALNYDEGEPVNLGTGQETRIHDLARMIADISGFHGEIRWNEGKPDGQPRRCLDVTRAAEKFGFRATTSLEEGLRQTIIWYENARSVLPAVVGS
jgi:GDP-L-fucose synthase